MPVEVILPKVDMDMTHGTLATWHVARGETVTKGAPLFDIETDKAAMEVEAPATGTLAAVTAQPGDRIAVGMVIAMIYAIGEAMVGALPPSPLALPVLDGRTPDPPTPGTHPPDPLPPTPAPAPTSVVDRPTAPLVAAVATGPAPPRATPAARTAARAAGLALDTVPGTGPLGRIQRDDITTVLTRGPLAAPAVWSPQPGPLHVSHRPGSGMPLVLIHGFTADSQSWAPLEKMCPPDRALIRIDLPGHGRSPRRRVQGFADLSRMVTEAFDNATRDAGTVHLLGHSLGGALALAITDIRARRVASLTLIAPAGLGPEIDAAALGGIVRATRSESLGPWLRRLTATPEGISDAYVRTAMTARADPALRAVQAEMAGALFPDGVQSFDLRAALSRLDRQACVIWGRQDHIVPYTQVLAAGGEFAIHLLAGAGHVPQIECPDRVARIVLRHLAAAEAPL